jgi:uncharacterized protein
MSTRRPRRSTDEELDAFEALCDRLSGFGDVVDPEWADAFLTALVAGPVRLPPERWLEAMAGDAFERAFADPPDRAQAMQVLSARIAAIEDALDADALLQWPDDLRLDPLMTEIGDTDRARMVEEGAVTAEEASQMRTGAVWAEGFLDAVGAFAATWGTEQLPEAAREAYLDLVSQVSALLIPPGSEDEREFAALYHPDGLPPHDALVNEALFAVQDLRVWWLDHGPRPEARRVAPQPGRNDPCPCGSGKKFKKCHGLGGA